ncbi:MAG: 1-acyl-sn-glycerol-3-phosphate acyltransferase [Rhodospirillaceae bacterium]|nr:1-acyl-sn-glycerol-3-phosphate acyltransferase [Rhodospirillaceae bacterium]|tara:strand:+ start:6000 stop:6638 length:639 start_codon:yes stop_codon:yes gene_type:complete
MSQLLRYAFFIFLVRPVVLIVMGLNIRRRELLPDRGPAIIIANHNSHLDTMVLMSLMPLRLLKNTHPVAAANYFLRNPVTAWFATKIIGIIPISRKNAKGNPLAGCFQALEKEAILVIFPEGSRGNPEDSMSEFKQGIRVIARKFPNVPVSPVFLHGLGKSLPKGEALFVPFFCDVFVGESFRYEAEKSDFMESLRSSMNTLASEGEFPPWD